MTSLTYVKQNVIFQIQNERIKLTAIIYELNACMCVYIELNKMQKYNKMCTIATPKKIYFI